MAVLAFQFQIGFGSDAAGDMSGLFGSRNAVQVALLMCVNSQIFAGAQLTGLQTSAILFLVRSREGAI